MVDLLMDVMTNPNKESRDENLKKFLEEKRVTNPAELFVRIGILQDVSHERERQEFLRKSGKFTFTCASTDPSVTHEEKLAVLAEEFGEVSKEVVEHIIAVRKHARMSVPEAIPDYKETIYCDKIRKELIQVAAVCVAWIEALDSP
jgi:hypothetical protein